MQKPIFRWTIGTNVLPAGYKILHRSIQEALRVYGSGFDWYVCYNLEESQIENMLLLSSMVAGTPVKLLKQTWHDCPIREDRPKRREKDLIHHNEFGGSLWKVCPARLNQSTHEIIVDNDVVITHFIEEIKEFLNSSHKTLVTQDCFRHFARYEHLHEPGVMYNSGVLGMPPGYDFAKELLQIWENTGCHSGFNYGDEQGLLTLALVKQPHIVIPTTQLPVLHACNYAENNFTQNGSGEWKEYEGGFFDTVASQCKGFHFVEANRINGIHKAWDQWLQRK